MKKMINYLVFLILLFAFTPILAYGIDLQTGINSSVTLPYERNTICSTRGINNCVPLASKITNTKDYLASIYCKWENNKCINKVEYVSSCYLLSDYQCNKESGCVLDNSIISPKPRCRAVKCSDYINIKPGGGTGCPGTIKEPISGAGAYVSYAYHNKACYSVNGKGTASCLDSSETEEYLNKLKCSDLKSQDDCKLSGAFNKLALSGKICYWDSKSNVCREKKSSTDEEKKVNPETGTCIDKSENSSCSIISSKCSKYCSSISSINSGTDYINFEKCVSICQKGISSLGKSGKGSSGSKYCADNYDYVAGVFGIDCDLPINKTAENASCTESAVNHYEPPTGTAEYAYVNKLLGVTTWDKESNKDVDDYHNNRYTGTCKKEGTSATRMLAFCIEPTYEFSNQGYVVQSVINDDEESSDHGFVRMYQQLLAKQYSNLGKYVNINGNNTYSVSDGTYEVMHLAFRLYAYTYGAANSNGTIAAYIARTQDNLGKKYLINAFNGSGTILYNDFKYSFNNKNLYRGSLTGYKGNTGINGYFYDKANGALNVNTFAFSSNRSGRTNTITNGSDILDKAFQLFLDGINESIDIWNVPVKAETISDNMDGSKTIKLSGFNGFKNGLPSGVTPSYVKSISCYNCNFVGGDTGYVNDEARKILPEGKNEITLVIKPTTVDDYHIDMEYFDWRSPQNVLIAIKDQAHQKIPLITEEPRPLTYSFEFDNVTGFCSINNGTFYDKEGKETSLENFADINVCCESLKNDSLYTAFSKSSEWQSYMTKEWVNAGCKKTCEPKNPENTECNLTSGSNSQSIVYDELTKKSDTDSNPALAGLSYNMACLMGQSKNYSYEYDPNYSPYCTVGCAQSYTFNMPTKMEAKTGTYLAFSVPASTHKVCATSKINHKQFKIDYDTKKAATLAAIQDYNTWVGYAKTAASATISSTSTTCKHDVNYGKKCPSTGGASLSGNSCSYSTTDKNGGDGCEGGWTKSPSITAKGDTYSCSKNAEDDIRNEDCSPSKTSSTFSYITPDGTTFTSSGNCGDKCQPTNGTAENVIKQINDIRDSKKAIALAAVKDLVTAVNNYNNCFNINKVMQYDPILTFSYEENHYMDMMSPDKNVLTKNDVKTSKENSYYKNVIERTDGIYFNNPVANAKNYVLQVYTEDLTETTIGKETYNPVEPRADYTKLDINGETTLTNKLNWYAKTGGGNATLTKNSDNYITLGSVFPVTNNGGGQRRKSYPYELKVSNIGGLDAYFSKLNRDSLSYSCIYDLYCHEICSECETNYFYRPISLNDVFPKGVNDASSKKGSLTYFRNITGVWATEKGQATQSEIEETGENIYIENDTDNHLQYSYTLTPTGMKNIREYNRTTNYGDFNLTCVNGVNCTNTFLNSINKKEFNGVTENKRNTEFVPYNGAPWK